MIRSEIRQTLPEMVEPQGFLQSLTLTVATAGMQGISHQQMFRQPGWPGIAVDRIAEEAEVPLALMGAPAGPRPLGPRREEVVVEEAEQELRRAAQLASVAAVGLTVLAAAVVVHHETAAPAERVGTANRGS